MLLGSDPSQNVENDLPYHNPHVTFAYTKHLWMDGKEQLAYDKLSRFVNVFKMSVSQNSAVSTSSQHDANNRLLARCYMKLGLWMNKLQGLNDGSINNILSYYDAATKFDQGSYKAWHSWAYANFKVIQTQRLALLSQKSDGNANAAVVPSELARKERENQLVLQYAVPALKGFFRSINLSQGNSLQDTLRLLTLWFDYGQTAEVIDALNEGIRIIEINTWLQVIPQLIARIDTPRLLVGQLIHKLLSDIGKSHPQALVYPLTVAAKSASQTRKNAANIILNSMMEHSPTLVEQAKMISEELIRVAILWHEQWHEGLEEASRLYFADKNIKGMFEILSPLHAVS
jgi:serine/threonine-protein kinase mTOR